MPKKKILFVDDEPNILSGLKRMLRSMRKDFDLQFAESGQEALTILESGEFDVVVSDMRMPGIDGAELLGRVMELHPYSIRIMLTGQADEESILRTVGIVHQFLAKPCDPDELKAVLLRASGLHKLISQPSLKIIVSKIDSLPSLPEVYAQLRKAMVDPDISVAEVATIIEKDIAMSAKMMQLVNSAFFGLFKTIDSPGHAVNLLGIETVKNLVLGVGAFSEIKTASKVLPIQHLMSHSMVVAACAKKIAIHESCDKKLTDSCFLAGMLHDIGKLVLLAKLPEQYDTAMKLALEQQIPLRNAEREVFHSIHGDIGAYLMGLWGMRGEVVEGIGFHHRLNSYPEQNFNAALAVHVANAFYYEANPGQTIGQAHQLNRVHLGILGFTDKIDEWRELCGELLQSNASDQ
jgi:HD-like signal output (HDOD) protein